MSISSATTLVGSGSVVLLSAAASLSRSLSREAIPGLEDKKSIVLWGRNNRRTAYRSAE